VGIASTGTDPGIVEVIDGDNLHVSPSHSAEPLVALELPRPTAAPVAPLSPVGDDTKAATDLLVRYLESLPDSSSDEWSAQVGHKNRTPFHPAGTDDFPWCSVWPHGPGCKN
jgi:hypothetical protein